MTISSLPKVANCFSGAPDSRILRLTPVIIPWSKT